MRYHPEIGTSYIPNLKLRVAGERGGYLVRTNASGFRSDRDFARERQPRRSRAILFGDSQTAGDGLPNAQRFSDRLEQEVPGLEVYNYAISGTGPDQHFLAYQASGGVDHDLLIIAVHVENVRRVSRRMIESLDSSGASVFYSKPYFELSGGELSLRNVPVPKQRWSEQTLPDEYKPHVYSYTETNLFSHLTGRNRAAPQLPKILAPVRQLARSAAMRLSGFRPLPEYDVPSNPGWVLLRTILETWIRSSAAPVLLVPIPHYVSFVSSRDPTCYRARFDELAEATGCHLYDPWPELLKAPIEDRRLLWSEWSGHLSEVAHKRLAELLGPVVERLLRNAQVGGSEPAVVARS